MELRVIGKKLSIIYPYTTLHHLKSSNHTLYDLTIKNLKNIILNYPLKEKLMSNSNTINPEELYPLVQSAKNTIKNLISNDPTFFDSEIVTNQIVEKITLTSTHISDLSVFSTEPSNEEIMRCVDLTILDKKASDDEVIAIATRAAKEHCATVCVYPQHIPLVNQVMKEMNVSDVPPIAVVGFPFVKDCSESTTQQTVDETIHAISLGAKEIDMVLPLSFRDENPDLKAHFDYIKAVCVAAHARKVPVKVILETAYLSDYQIALSSMISAIAGSDWVKTSTGFAEMDKFYPGRTADEKGATPKSVTIMRLSVGHISLGSDLKPKTIGVKASGGVRNKAQALDVIAAGADRIGASNGISLYSKPSSNSKPSY